MGYVFLGIIVAILIIVLVISLCHSEKLKKEIEENKNTYSAERKILHDQLRQQEEVQCITWDELQKTKETNQHLEEELKTQERFCRNIQSSLEQYQNKEQTEQELDNAIAEKQASIDRLKEVSVQYEEIAAQIKELMEQKMMKEEEVLKAQQDFDTINGKVCRIMERYQAALKIEEGSVDGWTFELSKDEVRLIELIGEIGSMYRELREDLATIEWKKIWLPKLQDLNGKVGLEKRGIYCLEVRGSDGVCYVGQAVNIKERWYQHVKKMIGAMPKGNEKLYKFRPEDLIWKVLVSGDDVDLNEEERFWIDNLKCKEVGLNRI